MPSIGIDSVFLRRSSKKRGSLFNHPLGSGPTELRSKIGNSPDPRRCPSSWLRCVWSE